MPNIAEYEMNNFIDIFRVNFVEKKKDETSKRHISCSRVCFKLFQMPG